MTTYADEPEEKTTTQNKAVKVKEPEQKLTFIDDPNPGIPSIEKVTDVKPLSEEQKEDWQETIRQTHEALIRKYSLARTCEVHVKQGYDEQNDIDIWNTKKYKYHPLTIGEKHKLNDLNASIADLEKQVYDRLDAVKRMLDTIKDTSKLRSKIREALQSQPQEENKSVSYHELVDRRLEYQQKAMWLYWRMPEEIYNECSVSDANLALDIAGFIEANPHPLGQAAGIS